ncbi:N-acetyl-lysine deacetylase [Metallosphaera tengchongensis]|uniref:[LysW]-lysine/[LysW]-ornithine hydrolase n=1 Tax=Metallosphaera tengchongensis TaxID=1532350 RepID=A0A6N0NY50_9CREN|nr:N-acetyl-lysine deacetylase [Metallosphaera tengchongensis]QKR00030.1 N-acetyl-lysine deacetylase [Metallosphaera tengchongensis]
MELEKELLKQKGKEVLKSLIEIYTPSGEEGKAVDVFERISNWFNLELRKSSSNSFYLGKGDILLASHLDTIKGFIPSKVTGEEIYGRGAVDAKGPLTSMILAGWIMNERGCSVQIAALSDEENKSSGARELVSSGSKYSHIIVGEPTNTTHIAIEYRGILRVGISCKGNPEHSSSSTSNVILNHIPAILEVSQLPSEYSTPSIVPTVIRGGDSPNVTPDKLYVHFDVRYPHGVTKEEIISKFARLFPNCEISVGESIEPVKVSSSTPIVRYLMRGLIKQGIKPSLVRKAGTSDMNILVSLTNNIATYGPGDSRLEHTDFERITLDEIYIATVTYVNALEEICLKH